MSRLFRWSITYVTLAGILVGCATLPPAKPATDLKAIAGTWEGTVTGARGGQFAVTTTIREDGAVESIIPALSNPGPRFMSRVTVEGGQYRWKSETTGRTGTYTLHEGKGRRVLVSQADDGSSRAELTPKK